MSGNTLEISEIADLNQLDLTEMVNESKLDGFRHIQKLVDHYANGENRFSERGETLLGAFEQGRLVGVCGLNREPFSWAANQGRVRRMYVMKSHRRLGVGKRLIQEIVQKAKSEFDALVLRTESPEAGKFYLQLGFEELEGHEHATHILKLQKQ